MVYLTVSAAKGGLLVQPSSKDVPYLFPDTPRGLAAARRLIERWIKDAVAAGTTALPPAITTGAGEEKIAALLGSAAPGGEG